MNGDNQRQSGVAAPWDSHDDNGMSIQTADWRGAKCDIPLWIEFELEALTDYCFQN
jgi:hypothetical protein